MKTITSLYADLQCNRRHLVRERNLISDIWVDDNDALNNMLELALRNIDLAIDEIDFAIDSIRVISEFCRDTEGLEVNLKVGDSNV